MQAEESLEIPRAAGGPGGVSSWAPGPGAESCRATSKPPRKAEPHPPRSAPGAAAVTSRRPPCSLDGPRGAALDLDPLSSSWSWTGGRGVDAQGRDAP